MGFCHWPGASVPDFIPFNRLVFVFACFLTMIMGLYPSYATIYPTDIKISSQNMTTLVTIAGITIDFAVLTWNDDMMSIYKSYNPLSTQTSQFIYVGASITIAVSSDTISDITLIRTPSGNAAPSEIKFRTTYQDIISQYIFLESDVDSSFSFLLYRGNSIAQTIPLGTVVLFPAFFAEIIPLATTVNSLLPAVSALLLPCEITGTVISTTANVANFATYLSSLISTSLSTVTPAYCECVSSSSDKDSFIFGNWCEAAASIDVTTASSAPNTAGIISLSAVNMFITRSPAAIYPNQLTAPPTLTFVGTNDQFSVTVATSTNSQKMSFFFNLSAAAFTTTWSSVNNPYFLHFAWSDGLEFMTRWRFVSNCEESVIASMDYPCSVQGTSQCLFLFQPGTIVNSCTCVGSYFLDASCRSFIQYKSLTDTIWSDITDFSLVFKQDDSFRIAFLGSSDESIQVTLPSVNWYISGGTGTQYSEPYLLSDFLSWTQDEAANAIIKPLAVQLTLSLNGGVTDVNIFENILVMPYLPLSFVSQFTTLLTAFEMTFPTTASIPVDALYSVFLAYSKTDTTVTPSVTTYYLLEPLYCLDTSPNVKQSTTIKSHYLPRAITNAQCFLPLYLPALDDIYILLNTVFTTTPPIDVDTAAWRYSAQSKLVFTAATAVVVASNSAPSTICSSFSTWDVLPTSKLDMYAYPINSECLTHSTLGSNSIDPMTVIEDIKEAIIEQEIFIQAGIVKTHCITSCPSGLTIDTSSCQRCICATDSCLIYTRVAQVYFNNDIFSLTTNDDDISIINRYISQEYFIKLATTFFADFLQIARTITELAVYSSSDTSYFGLEEITVTPMNAVLNKNAAQQLLIYITLAVDGTIPSLTQVDTRFKVLGNRIIEYQTYSGSPRTTISNEALSMLGSSALYADTYGGQLFKPIKLEPGFSMYTIKPFVEMTAMVYARALCYQQQSCTFFCSYASCPTNAASAFADGTVLTDAMFWTSCEEAPSDDDEPIPEYTTLNVTCVDIYSRVSITNPTWCAPGFVDTYPEYSKLPCFTPSVSTPTLSSIPLPELDQMTTNTRYIAWHYTGPVNNTVAVYLSGVTTNYSQVLTNPASTDTTIRPWPTTYPILLGRFSAQAQFAQIQILNSLFASTSSGKIYMIVEEYPTVRLDITNTLVITHVDLCANSPCASSDEVCFPPTGQCFCPDGMSYSSSGICQNTCTDTCGSHGTCIRALNSTLQKYVSTCQCSSGWSGTSCEISESCPISLCSNHGYKTLNEATQKCADSCTCFDEWSPSDNCVTCSLQSTCSSTGTLNSSYTTCISCSCRQGYSDTLCSTRAIYGTMLFSNVTSTTSNSSIVTYPLSSPLVKNITTTSTLNVSQSLSTMSMATLITLQQDMVLSLNIDTSRVSIQRVARTDIEQVEILYFSIDDGGTAGTAGDDDDDDDDDDNNDDIFISYLKTVDNSLIRRYNVTFLIQSSSNDGSSYSTTAVTAVMQSSLTTTFTTSSDLLSSSLPITTNPSYLSLSNQNNDDSDNSLFPMFIPTAAVPTSISDLYQAWSDVQSNLPSTPIGNTQASQDLGDIENAENAYDPQCVASATVICPDGTNPFAGDDDDEDPSDGNPFYPPGSAGSDSSNSSKTSTTMIIIIIVVVVGGGIAAVILLLIFLCVLRSKEALCFAPNNDDKPDELIDPMSGMNLNATSRNGVSPQSKSNHHVSKSSTELTMISDTSVMTTTTISENGGSDHDSTSKASSVVTSVDASDENLPPDWEKVQHPTTGAIFYVNKKTLVSQNHSPNQQGESIW